MTLPRVVKARLVDVSPEGSIVVRGIAGEHLIVEMGVAQEAVLFKRLEERRADVVTEIPVDLG